MPGPTGETPQTEQSPQPDKPKYTFRNIADQIRKTINPQEVSASAFAQANPYQEITPVATTRSAPEGTIPVIKELTTQTASSVGQLEEVREAPAGAGQVAPFADNPGNKVVRTPIGALPPIPQVDKPAFTPEALAELQTQVRPNEYDFVSSGTNPNVETQERPFKKIPNQFKYFDRQGVALPTFEYTTKDGQTVTLEDFPLRSALAFYDLNKTVPVKVIDANYGTGKKLIPFKAHQRAEEMIYIAEIKDNNIEFRHSAKSFTPQERAVIPWLDDLVEQEQK